jgi:hypothetical protein
MMIIMMVVLLVTNTMLKMTNDKRKRENTPKYLPQYVSHSNKLLCPNR